MSNPQELLKTLPKEHDFFIGIDSDGCAFDTMEIKHKECFCPNTINIWNLQIVSKYVRDAWDFVNLYSKTRGCNRFLALLRVIDLLSKRKEVQARNPKLPDVKALIEWTEKETKLGEPTLEEYVKTIDEPALNTALKWSKAINANIADMVHDIPPFPFMRESLEKMDSKADAIVVSQTPVAALEREWKENNMDGFVHIIAGQEFGKKSEHLDLAAKGKYDSDKILMIGDAPGDFKAAQANDALFYPVNPGHEEASWERFYNEGLDKFFAGTYKGDYQQQLLDEFEKYLPELPPWEYNK